MKNLSNKIMFVACIGLTFACDEQRPNNPRTSVSQTSTDTNTNLLGGGGQLGGGGVTTKTVTEPGGTETKYLVISNGKTSTLTGPPSDTDGKPAVDPVNPPVDPVNPPPPQPATTDPDAFSIQLRNGKNCAGTAVGATYLAEGTGRLLVPCVTEGNELVVKPVAKRKGVFEVLNTASSCGYKRVTLQCEHFCFPSEKKVFCD